MTEQLETVTILRTQGSREFGPIHAVILVDAHGMQWAHSISFGVAVRTQDELVITLEIGPDPEPGPRDEALAAARKILEEAGLDAADLVNEWED